MTTKDIMKHAESVYVGVRLPLAELAMLDEHARINNRTRSNMLRRVLNEYTEHHKQDLEQ